MTISAPFTQDAVCFFLLMTLNLRSEAPEQEITWDAEQNTLIVDWTQMFGYPCRLVIHDWSQGLRWYSVIDGEINKPGVFDEPGINLFHETDNLAVQQWQQTVDPFTLNSARRFGRWSFALTRLAYEWPEVSDLLKSNPVLLWLTWHHFKATEMSLPELRQLLSEKQPYILTALGLYGSKSSVRMMRRIQIEEIGAFEARFIRLIWEQEAMVKKLSHHRSFTLSFMLLLKRFPWLAGSPLANVLENIECRWEFEDTCQYIVDALRMENCVLRLRECKSVTSVRRLHDRITDNMNRNEQSRRILLRDTDGSVIPFPPAPHQGTHLIKPVATDDELVKEGSQMLHCVASYANRVQKGEYYVYHMEDPEPLTIGVFVEKGKLLALDQVKGIRNRQPQPEAMLMIKDWVASIDGCS